MDEILSRKIMRRLALLAVINSVTLSVAASQPEQAASDAPAAQLEVETSPARGLGELLSQGWGSSERYSVTIEPRQATETESLATESNEAAISQLPPPKILRPKRKILQVDQPVEKRPELTQTTSDQKSPSLADLLQAPNFSGKVPMPKEAKERNIDQPALTAVPAKVAATRKSVEPTLESETTPTPKLTIVEIEQLAESTKTAAASPKLKVQAPQPLSDAPKPATEDQLPQVEPEQIPGSTAPTIVNGLEMPNVSERQAALLRDTMNQSGFGLLAKQTDQLPFWTESTDPETAPQVSSQSTIHATQLRNVAQSMLREAHSLMWRSANYSAKKKATAALRSVVAMRDAIAGGNQHANELELAMDAIRESRDFGIGVDAVANEQLKRLVAVHKTGVLKNQSLSEVSSLSAMTAYLDFAQEMLSAASGHQHEASYALQLLGKIEKRINGPLESQAIARAMTYHRAAIDIDPSNALAHYELGKTYHEQGLAQQAGLAFAKSIELSPSRDAYEMLMNTARQLGDIDTVHLCKHALKNKSLPSGLPVVQLEPALFAATYRPQHHTPATPKPKHFQAQPVSAQQPKSKPKHSVHAAKYQIKRKKPSSDVTTVSRLRNWFSFGR